MAKESGRKTTTNSAGAVEKTVRTIRRKTRKRYSSEDKIRIVLEGLRGEGTVAELFPFGYGLSTEDETQFAPLQCD